MNPMHPSSDFTLLKQTSAQILMAGLDSVQWKVGITILVNKLLMSNYEMETNHVKWHEPGPKGRKLSMVTPPSLLPPSLIFEMQWELQL